VKISELVRLAELRTAVVSYPMARSAVAGIKKDLAELESQLKAEAPLWDVAKPAGEILDALAQLLHYVGFSNALVAKVEAGMSALEAEAEAEQKKDDTDR
jgi:hypothetical protein